jgi:DNA-directed RNA polymerase subunit RPC12/RpoP
MVGGSRSGFRTFTCANCKALYQVVKVEAGPETIDREIKCHSCGAPLLGREGRLVVKYFLLRHADRTRQRSKAATAPRPPTT